ncbi:DeoR/GlpR family DNA-binding transcription regulator [Bacillus massiliigorillae]|uniref:DeoR/GlpR family DNA-binding transcription regulator n=1 Tax=Bacillus massiliigorillae TaxID=1243664 RepID=UPI0005AA98A7|nr:DeoR/GlpR family DNA-binding transcription regulator [Bacillus massiliigorillae]
MLTTERHQIILELLSEHGVVDLQRLVSNTQSSESTVRRDLALLEGKGLLRRIHGGATLPYSKVDEPNMKDKTAKNRQGKKMIAEKAASLIHDGDCIYLDAGSTVAEMLPFLVDKNIVVVTNGLMHVEALTVAKIPTYIIGGKIKGNTNAIVGSVALENLKQYRFDKSFLGMNGVNVQSGFTTPDPEEAALKKVAMSLSETSYVLVDKTKFTETFFAKVADVEAAVIITSNLDKEIQKQFEAKTNLKVVTS